MTNNPTIDGVSRELLERLVRFAGGKARNELMSVLDAPAVERKQPFAWYTEDYLIDKSSTTYDELTSNRWKAKGWPVQPLYTAPPEVAALQSTIAQLQARVQELESWRGEPFTYMRIDVDGNPYRCRAEDHGDSFPVYRAPPAPVSSDKYDDVLLPFLAMMRNELHANAGKGDRAGWLSMTSGECLLEIYYHLGKLQKGVKDGNELCITEYSADVANMAMMLADICGRLDATAALNEVRK